MVAKAAKYEKFELTAKKEKEVKEFVRFRFAEYIADGEEPARAARLVKADAKAEFGKQRGSWVVLLPIILEVIKLLLAAWGK